MRKIKEVIRLKWEQRLTNRAIARGCSIGRSTVGEYLCKGMTLFLLWEEHRQVNPDGFQYSWFCEHYNQWAGKLDLVMRQHHRAGEKTFLDYAGQTVPVINATTGETREAEIFLAVLGASSYTYAEATWTQQLPDWIGSHVRAFTFFGGVSEILVPDNLKSGVKKACRYDPDINPTYQALAIITSQ
jgi:transposase